MYKDPLNCSVNCLMQDCIMDIENGKSGGDGSNVTGSLRVRIIGRDRLTGG